MIFITQKLELEQELELPSKLSCNPQVSSPSPRDDLAPLNKGAPVKHLAISELAMKPTTPTMALHFKVAAISSLFTIRLGQASTSSGPGSVGVG